ncbi:MAG: galactokinase family protein [Candidatus Aminicenantes bacterium]|jgi:galactokinase
MSGQELRVSAPGRICLFGEHQDYFGLPIIAAAIDLRITISGIPRQDNTMNIRMPDIDEEETLPLGEELEYTRTRDYLKSGVNILKREGLIPSPGWDCQIRGNIPINSGTASSSALVVAWMKFLLEAVQDRRAGLPSAIANLAYLTEVAEFKEPGGKMDHYSSALGGVVSVHFRDQLQVRNLNNTLGTFVLADSLQRKDTTGTLGYIKSNVLSGAKKIQEEKKGFHLQISPVQEYDQEIDRLDPAERDLLRGTLLTRDLTAEGESLFDSEPFDHQRFGELLTGQQDILRNYLKISTPKIDLMLDAALQAGALGGKGNGSGGGGCIFAYAPDRAEEVAEALRKLDTKPFIINIGEGVKRET